MGEEAEEVGDGVAGEDGNAAEGVVQAVAERDQLPQQIWILLEITHIPVMPEVPRQQHETHQLAEVRLPVQFQPHVLLPQPPAEEGEEGVSTLIQGFHL